MRDGFRSWVLRTTFWASGMAAALSVFALLIGTGSYWLTRATDDSTMSLQFDYPEVTELFAVSRPPPSTIRLSVTEIETEARSRIEPITPVKAVSTGRMAQHSTAPRMLAAGDRVMGIISFYYCEHSSDTPRGDGGGFCGVMRDGSSVYEGAAACHYDYLGQLFRIEDDPANRIYRCADTGSAIGAHNRDIWFRTSDEGWRWRSQIGRTAEIEILP